MNKTEDKKKLFWIPFNWLFTIPAIAILISFACYYTGTTANWVIVAYFIAGIWAIKFLVTKYKKVASLSEALLWYFGVFVVIGGTIFILASNTLLEMYEDWSILRYTTPTLGCIRIFMPMIVLTIGSVMIAALSPQKGFSKNLVIICVIISVFALFLYGLVLSVDMWSNAYKKHLTQKFDLSRLKMSAELGLVVVVDEGADIYAYKINPNFPKETRRHIKTATKLDSKYRYPVVNLREAEAKDGPNRLILIYMPDQDGDFNESSDMLYVRLGDNIKIEPAGAKEVNIEKVSSNFWKISFNTNKSVRIIDHWIAGQKIFVSGPTEGEVVFQNDPVGGSAMFPLPIGVTLKRDHDSTLILKYKKGGKLFITFS